MVGRYIKGSHARVRDFYLILWVGGSCQSNFREELEFRYRNPLCQKQYHRSEACRRGEKHCFLEQLCEVLPYSMCTQPPSIIGASKCCGDCPITYLGVVFPS